MAKYNLHSLKLPVLTGTALKVFTTAVENPVSRLALINNLVESGGIPVLRSLKLNEEPTYYPLVTPEIDDSRPPAAFEPGTQPQSFPYRTIGDYTRAYTSGQLTPLEVAEKVLAAIEASNEGQAPLHTFIAVNHEDVLSQAQDATERYRSGKTLGALDGVPMAIKDEVDMKPYPTTVGTSFLGKQPAEDSTVAARLRAAGALLVGKTNMHEIGINPNGSNVTYGEVRNPYNTDCDTGGSSSGSAAAVAAGLVPAAIGADGGGSIRIPASLCGVVGLKPTFARVSEFGAAPLCWSVAHLGPLTASVEDAALIYAIIAGPDPRQPNTLTQPAVTLEGWNEKNLNGIRFGVFKEWFEHAAPEVVKTANEMVEQFKERGGEVVEITLAELDEMRVAHVVTILSEMALCMHNYREHQKEHALSTRLSLELGKTFTAMDYVQAQRMRTRAMGIFADAFKQVDVILTPGTALAAQPVPAGGRTVGWSDLGTDTEMMRYVFPSNLTGNPAITFPVGYDSRGLPISLQAIGRHWEENLLLRVAYNAEQLTSRHTPTRYYRIF